MNTKKNLLKIKSKKKELSHGKGKDSNLSKISKLPIPPAKENYTHKNHNFVKNITIKKFNNQNLLLKKKEKEIQTLKLQNEKLEKENQKYQQQNQILKTISLSNSSSNKNNTSSNFPMISEIKKLWEKFAKIDLLNNFIDYENEPELIYNIICEIILLSDKMIKEYCLIKYQQIIKIMGIKNSKNIIKDIEIQFKSFMKEHLSETFKDLKSEKFINDYKINLKNNITKLNIKSNKSNSFQIFNEIMENSEFIDMLNNINDIILFAQFNEPILYFNIEPDFQKRKLIYITIDKQNKNDYIIINDNGENKLNCIILLKPPCLKSSIIFYNELKPIVLIINNKISNNNFFDQSDYPIDKFSESYISSENNSNNSIDNIKKNLIHKDLKIFNLSKNIYSDCDFSSTDINVQNNNNNYAIACTYNKKQKIKSNQIRVHNDKTYLRRKIPSNLSFNSLSVNHPKTKTRKRTLSLNVKKNNYDSPANFHHNKINSHRDRTKIKITGNKNKKLQNKKIIYSTNTIRGKNKKYFTETENNSKKLNKLSNNNNCKINNFNINYINIINSNSSRYKYGNNIVYNTIEEIKKMIDDNIHKSISMLKNKSMFKEYSNINICPKSNRIHVKNKINNPKLNNLINISNKNNDISSDISNNNQLISFSNKSLNKIINKGVNNAVVNKGKKTSKKAYNKSYSNKSIKILNKKNLINNKNNKYFESISNMIGNKLCNNTFNSQENILNVIPQINHDKKRCNKNYYSFVNSTKDKEKDSASSNDEKKTRINIININSLKKKDN